MGIYEFQKSAGEGIFFFPMLVSYRLMQLLPVDKNQGILDLLKTRVIIRLCKYYILCWICT